MKQTRLMKMIAAGAVCAVTVATVSAQTSSTTTTTAGLLTNVMARFEM